MKKLTAVIISIILGASIAQGGRYAILDQQMNKYFWIDIENSVVYGNQLLLPAAISDYNGSHTISGYAMVIIDMRWFNLYMIYYSTFCTYVPHWDLLPSLAGNAQYGVITPVIGYNLRTMLDCIVPMVVNSNQESPRGASKPDLPDRAGAVGSGEADAITGGGAAPDPIASILKTGYMTSDFGHRYYFYDGYNLGHSICFPIFVEAPEASTDGLMFINGFENPPYPNLYFHIIIAVFENERMHSYMLVGIFCPQDDSTYMHTFVGYLNNEPIVTAVRCDR